MRIARPATDLARTKTMYCDGLGFEVLASFQDHEGFDGLILGEPAADCHLEFTVCRNHPIAPSTTPEDLLVLYVPTRSEWEQRCALAVASGFVQVASFNPYWDVHGRTYTDHDGYRVVLQNALWK